MGNTIQHYVALEDGKPGQIFMRDHANSDGVRRYRPGVNNVAMGVVQTPFYYLDAVTYDSRDGGKFYGQGYTGEPELSETCEPDFVVSVP